VVKIIKAMTNQQLLVDAITKMTWCLQWVLQGTGKTYTGVAMAVKALKEKAGKTIIPN
jgi:phosphate starvation-inducible PhoH-like protein